MKVYLADIRYRVSGTNDEVGVVLGLSGSTSEEKLEESIKQTCFQLEHQPTEPHYEIMEVKRSTTCNLCWGEGIRKVPPKNWRKKTLPPYYLMRSVPCIHEDTAT